MHFSQPGAVAWAVVDYMCDINMPLWTGIGLIVDNLLQLHLEESLRDVVAHLKDTYGVKYFYCWHGLSGYWGGVSLESAAVSDFSSELIYANPTPGVLEIEPSMGWGPASLAGVGIVQDPGKLYEVSMACLSDAPAASMYLMQYIFSKDNASLGTGNALLSRFGWSGRR
eukprot:scaffold387574_cov46-Prasinocladus_malaysianus.AAC.1